MAGLGARQGRIGRPGSPSVLVALLLAMLLLAACSSNKAVDGTSTSRPSGGSTTTTYNSFYPKGKIVPAPDTSTTTPREGPGQEVPQNIGAGQQIIITPNGFWPKTLYANFQVAITWTNLSGHPQNVSFDHIPVSSGTIPVGAQFVWKTHFGGSYTYSSTSGFHALLVLQAPQPIGTPTTTAP
jgi:hypothetical protein